MQRQLLPEAEKFVKQNTRRRGWRKIVQVMACIVVFCTTYALILPAITMEKTCELTEHVHDQSCYAQVTTQQVKELACAVQVHSHNNECGESCGYADFVVHTHDVSCYGKAGALVCSLPEIEAHEHEADCWKTPHVHDESCYAVSVESHIHSDSCYSAARGELLCTVAEGEGSHAHGEGCYTLTEVACSLEECEGHSHSEACYADDNTLVCQLEESEGHRHSEACVKTVSELICQLEESPGHQHGDACYEQIQTLTCEIPEGKKEVSVLVCTQEEGAVQTESGAEAEAELVCEEEEIILHSHEDGCYEITTDLNGEEQKILICTQTVVEEHIHDKNCFRTEAVPVDTESLTCTETAEAHEHSAMCYGTWKLNCELDEHTHTTECTPMLGLSEEDRTRVEEVIGLIGALPAEDEIATKLNGYYETENTGDEEAYLADVTEQVNEADEAYTALGGDLQQYVSNSDKLLALRSIEYANAPAVVEAEVPDETAVDPQAEPVYYCGREVHAHTDDCFDVYGNAICTMEEHAHTEACEIAQIYYCGKEAHTHNEACSADCQIEVHTHDATCLTAPTYYCGLEDAADHVHDESCLISPYQCGLEKHLHDETCPDDCAIVEHVHTESCKDEQSYHCGLGEHQHADGCYDADGILICTEKVHTHTDDCLLVYYCGIVNEHSHDDCYENFVHTCGKIGHKHFYLCTSKPQYCDEEHIHNAACYDENGILTCKKHTHILSCWINPASSGTSTDPEGTFAGSDRFHSSYFLKYQASGHTVSKYEIGTFVLIPESANVEGWVPNTRQWSGNSRANYLVAYCSDDRTSASKKGEEYETYTLDTSRFTNDEQRRKIAAIIGSSYPFLTAEEMRQQLNLAYEQGLTVDNNGNVIDIRDSVESDWIGATQWALWDTTSTYGTHATTRVDIDDKGNDRPAAIPSQSERYCINPLTDPGYTDIAESRQKLEAIHNWLMSLQEPEALTVQNYTYEITENEDGTYKLTVDVTLNRQTVVGENTVFQLSVGSKSTAINELEAEMNQFQMILDGITLEEIANARVYLNVDGRHMQAYFFDSFNYQDMIGGNWEYYSDDLSFDVAADVTDVTVYKKWTEGAPADIDAVTVQLYADGKAYGDPVQLSEANGWTHTWEDLNKYHISGTKEDGTIFGGDEIAYTVVETPVPGYYSSLTQVEKFGNELDEEAPVTITYWKEVDTFAGEGEYVLLSDVGALTISAFNGTYYMNVSPIDLSVVTDAQHASVWVAEGTEGTGYTLASKLYPDGYICYEVIGSEADAKAFFVENGLLFYKSGTSNIYFRSFYSDGYQVYTSDSDLAMHFRLYKLTTEELASSEINFLLTNSEIPEDATAAVTITKKWEGRRDTNYPLSATVTLMQDGRPYGDTVTLNAANNWTYTWEDLPYEMNGARVEYSVEETPIPGYESTYTIQDDINTDDRALILTLTNTWTPSYVPLDVKKADIDKPEKFLAGAQFDVYVVDQVSEEAVHMPGTDYSGVLLENITIPEAGTVYQFEVGEIYCLVETAAPGGYNKLTEPVVVKVGASGFTVLSGGDWTLTGEGALIILNKHGYELPKTGGTGTNLYTMGGLLLMAAAAILLYIHNPRRRKGDTPSF